MTHATTSAAEFDLDAVLEVERARLDAALAEVAAEIVAAAAPALREPIRYALETRGKRLRPLLLLAAYRAVAGDAGASDAVYRLASAVEIVHTYSLVHDDLPCMDDDDLRRGRPTVHRVLGVGAAMLAGAALIPAAAVVLDSAAVALELPPAVRAQLLRELCAASGASGMVAGQWLDLEAESAPVDAARLERIHRLKTGALLAASLRVGAIAAGAAPAALAALTRFGQELGLAFQIVDDLLDLSGAPELLGKTTQRDLHLGKATYPALHGEAGARALAAEHVARARRALDDAELRAPMLTALARFVVERAH